MILERIEHPGWLSNTWIAAPWGGGKALVVDAGGPAAPVLELLGRHDLEATHILLTHHHGDHVAEREVLRRATGARVGSEAIGCPTTCRAEGRSAACGVARNANPGWIDTVCQQIVVIVAAVQHDVDDHGQVADAVNRAGRVQRNDGD